MASVPDSFGPFCSRSENVILDSTFCAKSRIYVKDHKQYDVSNPFEHLGPKQLAPFGTNLFREENLHNLPAEKLFPLYSEHYGRRTNCRWLGKSTCRRGV